MKLLFVVQRYGPTIAGGAEHLVREYATRLADRNHEVEVLTSCAHSYSDWADVDEPGTTQDAGVTVHRLRVRRRRPNHLFGPLHGRATSPASGRQRRSWALAQLWAETIGPELDGLVEWLGDNATRFDAVVFSGYLYTPSTSGLPAVADLVPTVLQSVAHDEAPLRLPVMRQLFDHAAGINFLTDEEQALVRTRFRPAGVCRVIGAGVGHPPPSVDAAAVAAARERLDLGDRPYLVCIGRIDPAKGMHEAAGYFAEYRRRHDEDLALVFVGSEVHPLDRSDHVRVTGFVDDADKWALIAGASALVQPSYFESFSLSLAEGWRCGLPALVQGRNDVLVGQVRRARGGLTYRTYAEFDAALSLLANDAALRSDLGEAGRTYVDRYDWPQVLDSFERLVADTIVAWKG